MSLEYAIEYHCQVRRNQGEASIRMLARTSALISRVVSETIEQARIPSDETVNFTTRYAGDLEKIEEVSSFCQNHCPAGLDMGLTSAAKPRLLRQTAESHEPLFCLGRIRYPIESRFEHFVADRVQLIYDNSPPDELPQLMRVLLDSESPFDGEVTKEVRRITTSDGLRFYERRLPITMVRTASRLTTDNIFDLFAGFRASDDGKTGYQRELPPFTLPDYSDLLDSILTRDLGAEEIVRLGENSSTYTQFLRFGRAVSLAEMLNVRLLLD